MFDSTGISEPKRHFYFFAVLILMTVLAGTIKHHFCSAPPPEQKELTDGAKRLLETGSVVKDLY
jgi:hypothetical protein